jgi:hypothetical protein
MDVVESLKEWHYRNALLEEIQLSKTRKRCKSGAVDGEERKKVEGSWILQMKRWTVFFWCIKRANHPREARNTFFHLEVPQKIWGAGIGKSVACLGFARSHHQKRMIGLWIKSMKISILKQKHWRLYGFQRKFCEDKKLRFCDVGGDLPPTANGHKQQASHFSPLPCLIFIYMI